MEITDRNILQKKAQRRYLTPEYEEKPSIYELEKKRLNKLVAEGYTCLSPEMQENMILAAQKRNQHWSLLTLEEKKQYTEGKDLIVDEGNRAIANLYDASLGTILLIAHKYFRLQRGVTLDEFFSEAVQVFFNTIEIYDRSKGANFNTFLFQCLKWNLSTFSKQLCGITQIPHDISSKMSLIVSIKKACPESSITEIAKKFKMTPKTAERMLNYFSDTIISLDTPLEDSKNTWEDYIPDKKQLPVTDEGEQNIFFSSLSVLTPKQRFIVVMHQYYGYTLREIGNLFDPPVTKANISRIELAALKKLRESISHPKKT